MRKFLTVLLAVTMVLATMTVLATPANAAAVEGDWVTSRAADAYEEGVTDYTPAAGYQYTTEGLQTVSPNFTNCNPYVQVHTKQAYNLKDPDADGKGNAISVGFTVTEFAYNGELHNKDAWISVTLHSQPIVAQGHTKYGSGLCILIRGDGEGAATAQAYLVDQDNNLFKLFTSVQINPNVNKDGKEEYTFSVKYDGSKYVMNMCGADFSDSKGELDAVLNDKCAEGAYLGLSLLTTDAETPASLLITDFQGSVPYGEDTCDPEPNVKSFAEIADSATVPAGQPAVKWDGKAEQCDKISISNADFTAQDNGIVTLHANSPEPYINFIPKNDVSYEASDFPIIAVLTKNCWAVDGQVYYMAGKTLGANSDCLLEITIDEINFGEGWGMSILDLTDDPDWEGRINGIRVDFKGIEYTEEQYASFDVAYFGAFRTVEDAEQYAKDYLIALLGKLPETTEKPTEEPTTEAPETNATTNAPEGQGTSDEASTDAEKSDCNSVIAAPVVALIALLGIAFAAKKKD